MPRRYPSLRTFRAIHIIPERGTFSGGNECCICLDRYDNNAHRPVSITSNRECEHVFGHRCLETYLDSTSPGRDTCPVCRRKWYSRRSMNLFTPRDTNTSQVLSPTQPATSIRDGSESRSLHRSSLQVVAQADRAVEQLVSNIEALEALERRGTMGLEQDIRVRLQQVHGRIYALLQRNVRTPEVSFGPVPHRRSRHMMSSARGNSTNHQQEPVVAEMNDGQHPHSLSGAAFQGSSMSSLELPSPGQRSSLQIDDPSVVTSPSSDYRRDFAAVERRPSQFERAATSTTLITGPRVESSSYLDSQRNVALPQLTSQSAPGQEVNASGVRDPLRAPRHNRLHNTGTQAAGLRSSMLLPDIAETGGSTPPLMSARTSITQATDTGHTHQHTQPPMQNPQNHRHATEHAPILFPRYKSSSLHRVRSAHEFAHDAQSVDAPPQPILASPMAEQGAGLRRRATVTEVSRGLSRIMSISSLRNLVASNRAR